MIEFKESLDLNSFNAEATLSKSYLSAIGSTHVFRLS